MKKIICNYALTVLLVFTSSHSFASNVLLDTATGNTSTGYLFNWGGEVTKAWGSSPSYGNVISPASDMNVGSFSFQMRENGSNDTVAQPFTAYIYASDSVGVLSGSAIAQSNEQSSTTSTSFTEVKAELTSTAALTAGNYYTLFFTTVGVSGADSNFVYNMQYSNVDDSQSLGAWYNNNWSNFTSNNPSDLNFQSLYAFALKVYEADVMVVKKSRGTGPGGKDLSFFEHLVYFALTQVLTDIPSPS